MPRKPKFEDLSRKEKRLAIAKDALKQVEAGIFIPTGSYLSIYGASQDQNNCQLNKLVKQGEVECVGCIKAAVFLSHVVLTNHLTVKNVKYDDIGGDSASIIERLKGIFTQKELHIIEVAYEIGNIFKVKDKELVERAIKFGRQHDDRKGRMIAILKNMIENNGTFKP